MAFALFRRRRDLPLSHVRLIALALLAVLLPAIVLLILQYRSLCDVQQTTRIAVRESLRKAAGSVAWRVQGDMERIAEEVLLPVPSKLFVKRQPPWTAECAQSVFKEHPEVEEIFLVINDPGDSNLESVAYVYSPSRALILEKSKWCGVDDIERATAAHERADLLAGTAANARSRFCYWQDSAPADGSSPSPETAYVSYCLLDPESEHEVGFVGFRLDMAQMREHYLPQLVSELSRNEQRGPASAELVLGVLDREGRQICSSAPSVASYAARASLAPVLPRWEATAGFRTADVDDLARASFEKGLWFTVLVVTVLLAGIAMIVRAAVRELKLAEVKQTFVSNVSHELKTPLALIRLFAETLEMGRVKTSEKAQEYYRIIYNESRRLSQLIDNILDFSRIEAGSREYSFVPVDLAEATRAVVETYEYQIRAAGFELATRFDPDLPRVEADPDAISQAILNLVNNSVKYSDETKQISVSVRMKDGGVAVEVADRGIGIPLSEQRRIFEKFYRVSTGLVHETKGSGLGLALVKHIVEAHRGRVSVESAPRRGSRFTLWLPAMVEANGTDPAAAREGDLVAQSVDHRG
ncbi:MAG TPA: HAMP domain-containing sensor histidine kinase [Terriglobia bacterium]|nr:HAMP domain-containing sensor histidine kinase [Terriglobia bacterium]